MRSPSGEIQLNHMQEVDAKAKKVEQHALDDFIERMTGDGCLQLLKWARCYAPHLLRMLMVSFLTGQAPGSDLKAIGDQSSSPSGSPAKREIRSQETATLRTAEREHIARVISHSRTLSEAASKLGISSSTLWRKRKLYRLG